MGKLVGIQRCIDGKTWIAFSATAVRWICYRLCGREMASWCWGGLPKPGDRMECTTAYCELVWARPEVEMTYVEPEVARG